ncbi:MAG: hypothetical protein AAFX01_13215 [Cyanobacteria bacterium J06638_28]
MNYRFLALSVASACLLGAVGYANISNATSAATLVAQNASPEQGQRQGRHHRIDFAAAATELGTTEAELKTALGLPENPPERQRPDLAAAATQLGVTETQLQTALGITIETVRPRTRPDLTAVAADLGVTEAALREALGKPEGEGGRQGGRRRPRLDIAGAANQLGVTEDALIEALGIPAERPEN